MQQEADSRIDFYLTQRRAAIQRAHAAMGTNSNEDPRSFDLEECKCGHTMAKHQLEGDHTGACMACGNCPRFKFRYAVIEAPE